MLIGKNSVPMHMRLHKQAICENYLPNPKRHGRRSRNRSNRVEQRVGRGRVVAEDQSLVPARRDESIALRNAVSLWADATTDTASGRRKDLLRDKTKATLSFFELVVKHPAAVLPADVKRWQGPKGGPVRAAATVYTRLSLLSSFFEWAMREPAIGAQLSANPVRLARPKAPCAYRSEERRVGK